MRGTGEGLQHGSEQELPFVYFVKIIGICEERHVVSLQGYSKKLEISRSRSSDIVI